MTTLHLTAGRGGPPRCPEPARTLVVKDRPRPTFTAPVSDPGGATRSECWGATSLDGVWRYERQDDDDTTWSVTYAPTGQSREHFGTLTAATEATAGLLLRGLVGEAIANTEHADSAVRALGQWRMAVHMRLAGADEVTHRCGNCDGLLVVVTSPGRPVRYGHVDACDECFTPGRAGFADDCHGDPHRFCGNPDPVVCGHQPDNRCTAYARPDRGTGCGGKGGAECCGVCCWPPS